MEGSKHAGICFCSVGIFVFFADAKVLINLYWDKEVVFWGITYHVWMQMNEQMQLVKNQQLHHNVF